MNWLGLGAMLLSHLGDLPKVVKAAEELEKIVIAVESKTLTGAEKMTAVLNDFEAALDIIDPTLGKDFTDIAAGVEEFTNQLVARFNAFAKAK